MLYSTKSSIMWKNYLKIAFRNIWKQRSFAFINVLGLALGMACCFLIMMYVSHEMNYDRFLSKLDRIYRIDYALKNRVDHIAAIPAPIGPELKGYFPEIEEVVRFYRRNISAIDQEADKQFELENALFVDSTFANIFDLEFLEGTASTALNTPFSVVLTESNAIKIFGKTDVIGKKLQLSEGENFQITGVVSDWTKQAHFEFDLLTNYENMPDVEPEHARENIQFVMEKNWIASHTYTYVMLKPNQSAQSVNDRFEAFILEKGDEKYREKQNFKLVAVKDIHLESTAGIELKETTSLSMLYLFIGIGFITLLIACINFINLATAGSLNRAKEVGVRKVLGARRRYLVGQFLGESTLLSFVAFLCSMQITFFALPYLNDLTGLELQFSTLLDGKMILLFLGIFLLAGLMAGSYPAFFVTKFKPVDVLKSGVGGTKKPGAVNIRKALITVQFVVAIAFISSAAIIFMQLQYMMNQPMGFDKDLQLVIPIDNQVNMNALFRPGDAKVRQKMNTLDDQLMAYPDILAVTQSANMPGFSAVNRNVWTEKVPAEERYFCNVLAVDYDYVEAFGLELATGRDFDLSYGVDHLESFVINESAVSALGFDDTGSAIGGMVNIEGKKGKVIGVLKDYNFSSLHTNIEPLVMEIRPGSFRYFAVKINNDNIAQTIEFIKGQWKDFFPQKGFEYTFLNEDIQRIYQSEDRLSTMISYFAFLAIFISCFGLFGLAALITKQRFKEIGIRKVLGASVQQILNLLAKDFVILIFIAMVFAIPLTWYFLSTWMENFAYAIDFPWWVAIVVGLGVILLAFITISAQTIKTALSNPVEALRYE